MSPNRLRIGVLILCSKRLLGRLGYTNSGYPTGMPTSVIVLCLVVRSFVLISVFYKFQIWDAFWVSFPEENSRNDILKLL